MNDQQRNHDPERIERSLRVWLTEGRPPLADRDARINEVLDSLDDAPQTRARFLGRWLERGGGAGRRTDDHDHPPNTNRRNRLMFSATAITAALAILAISVNVVNTEPSVTNQAGASHVVAADGSGDFGTIQAAVDAAADGDTISIRPGTYVEAIVLDKSLTLAGDGPRDEIVITAPDDGPLHDVDFSWLGASRYALLLSGSDAELRDFTLSGEDSRLFVEGGAPTVRDLLFEEVGLAYAGSAVTGAVVVQGLASPLFVGNELVGGGGLSAFGDANPVFEGNVLHESGAISGDFGDTAVIRDNTVTGAGRQGITFLGATSATVVGNTIEDKQYGITTGDGIDVTTSTDGSTFEPLIEGNTISGAEQWAVNLLGGSPVLKDNTLAGGRIGLNLLWSTGTVSGSDISGFSAGAVIDGGPVTMSDNSITGNERGLTITLATEVALSGNYICDNETNLRIVGDEEVDTTGNEICEDPASSD